MDVVDLHPSYGTRSCVDWIWEIVLGRMGEAGGMCVCGSCFCVEFLIFDFEKMMVC